MEDKLDNVSRAFGAWEEKLDNISRAFRDMKETHKNVSKAVVSSYTKWGRFKKNKKSSMM